MYACVFVIALLSSIFVLKYIYQKNYIQIKKNIQILLSLSEHLIFISISILFKKKKLYLSKRYFALAKKMYTEIKILIFSKTYLQVLISSNNKIFPFRFNKNLLFSPHNKLRLSNISLKNVFKVRI